MYHSHCWEANSFSASRKISRILWHPEGSLPRSRQFATCPYTKTDQSSSPHPISWRSTLILSSCLLLSLQSGFLPSELPTKSLYALLLSPIHATCPTYLIPLISSPATCLVKKKQIIKLLIMQFPPPLCYLVYLKPIYLPQHHILEHPQPTLFPQYEKPSSTPIQNK